MKTFVLIFLAAGATQAQSINLSILAGNPAVPAQFSRPGGVAVDAAGNVYVADTGHNTIQKITPAGAGAIFAGVTGVSGSNNGLGSSALFNQPAGLAVDAGGNIYVADFGNSAIREISPAGQVSTLAAFAGLLNQPEAVAVDVNTNIYVADYGDNAIRKMSPAGTVTTLAGTYSQPGGIAVDGLGNVYVADTANNVIREITPGGAVSILAGTTNSFGSLDGSAANALFYQPVGLAVDSATNLYVADYINNTIRQITPAGVVSTLAGLPGNYGSADGAGGTARFWGPLAVAVDSADNLYVADSGNNTLRKIAAGVVSTFAGQASSGYSNALGGAALFNSPQSVAADPSGDVYVADSQNNAVRKVTAAGFVSTVAQFFGPQGIALDNSGNVYVSDTANNRIQKISPGGAVATMAGAPSSLFNHPLGLALDGSGNLYVADSWDNTVDQITPGGTVNTRAGLVGKPGSADGPIATALFNQPSGLAVDSAGNIYVTDYNNQTVREISVGGNVTTLAGLAGIWGDLDGVSTNARFNGPLGLALDASGNLYVADSGNYAIRKLSPSGTNWIVTTVANAASPAGVALNASGTFYASDSVNNTILFNGSLAPYILVQPQSQTNAQGAVAVFSVTATGSAPLAYFWQYNSAPFTSGVNTISATQAGNYSVTVSNLAGVAVSAPASLTLTNALPGSFQGISVLPNGSVQLQISGTAGTSYALQASTNLMDWTTLTILTNNGSTFQFTDPSATGYQDRFYRLSP